MFRRLVFVVVFVFKAEDFVFFLFYFKLKLHEVFWWVYLCFFFFIWVYVFFVIFFFLSCYLFKGDGCIFLDFFFFTPINMGCFLQYLGQILGISPDFFHTTAKRLSSFCCLVRWQRFEEKPSGSRFVIFSNFLKSQLICK